MVIALQQHSQNRLAKIDLEGHELSALKGWEPLRDHKVKSIYIEIMEENQNAMV